MEFLVLNKVCASTSNEVLIFSIAVTMHSNVSVDVVGDLNTHIADTLYSTQSDDISAIDWEIIANGETVSLKVDGTVIAEYQLRSLPNKV